MSCDNDDILMVLSRTRNQASSSSSPREDPFHLYPRKMSTVGLEEKLADFYHRQNVLIDSFLAVPGQVGERDWIERERERDSRE
jgi:hypothetical protein